MKNFKQYIKENESLNENKELIVDFIQKFEQIKSQMEKFTEYMVKNGNNKTYQPPWGEAYRALISVTIQLSELIGQIKERVMPLYESTVQEGLFSNLFGSKSQPDVTTPVQSIKPVQSAKQQYITKPKSEAKAIFEEIEENCRVTLDDFVEKIGKSVIKMGEQRKDKYLIGIAHYIRKTRDSFNAAADWIN